MIENNRNNRKKNQTNKKHLVQLKHLVEGLEKRGRNILEINCVFRIQIMPPERNQFPQSLTHMAASHLGTVPIAHPWLIILLDTSPCRHMEKSTYDSIFSGGQRNCKNNNNNDKSFLVYSCNQFFLLIETFIWLKIELTTITQVSTGIEFTIVFLSNSLIQIFSNY